MSIAAADAGYPDNEGLAIDPETGTPPWRRRYREAAYSLIIAGL
ncbi:hypothetical protein M2271_000372 [Streptomyces sp. LBL]|nr:hypothetical protein [Streptomyces sp. LBL]MDH6622585.1 hypothetical protein [Streptomyces sp. LBL]